MRPKELYPRKAVDRADPNIGVVVVDQERRWRRVVSALLAGEDDIEVVGEASDGEQAVLRAQDLMPDLILLDVRMPGANGIEAARAINRLLPTTRIIMLTASDEEDDVYEALKAGASGYLLKETLLEDLAGAVRAVGRGLGLLLSPSVAAKLVTEFKQTPRAEGATSGLTVRELEVLRLVSLGRANHEIASELHLSSHTVKRHVANILAKLHERSRLDAVMHAIRAGVLADAPVTSA
jgi:two-component system NarL family response regulator